MEEQKQADTGIMDISDAAAYLKFSRRKLYDLVRRGEIPHKKIGRQYRFTRRNLDEWLSGPPSGVAAAKDAPRREPTDEDLLARVAAEPNPYQRRLLFAAVLSRAMTRRGKSMVVVGGHAAEFYTNGDYVTGDIDLVCGARDVLHEVLSGWGFTLLGFTWSHKGLGLFVEAPGGSLRPGEEAHLVTAETQPGLEVVIYGVEDLTVDRLNACVHWKHEDDCRWAREFLRIHWARVDWDYLRGRCRAEGTTPMLESIVEELRKERGAT